MRGLNYPTGINVQEGVQHLQMLGDKYFMALTPGAVAVVDSLQAAGADVLDPAGRAWDWAGARWRCLEFRSAITGDDMCALSLRGAGGSLLVLGAAGTDDQEQLVAMYGNQLRADLVITPPGGSLAPSLVGTAQPPARCQASRP